MQSAELPAWVQQAAQFPIGFAQVREDPLLDLEILNRTHPGAEVLMVASGGCTACALAASDRVSSLHLVDPNRSQLALTRVKLWLLQEKSPEERLRLLGHSAMALSDRTTALAEVLASMDLPQDALGPLTQVAEVGPDYAGRYERLFHHLRRRLRNQSHEWEALLKMGDPRQQSLRVGKGTLLGRSLDEALDEAMALPNLVQLFGKTATANQVMEFSRHFARQVRAALALFPAKENPFLWQMLAGCFPPGVKAHWLDLPPPSCWPRVFWTEGSMAAALTAASEAYDLIHLSNILDWLSPSDAEETLGLAWRALKRGGCLLVRQLNSSLAIRALGASFKWLDSESAALLARDRSFFYRAIHLGHKK